MNYFTGFALVKKVVFGSTKRLATGNRSRVSICVTKKCGQVRGVVDPVQSFLSSGLIIIQNLVVVCLPMLKVRKNWGPEPRKIIPQKTAYWDRRSSHILCKHAHSPYVFRVPNLVVLKELATFFFLFFNNSVKH